MAEIPEARIFILEQAGPPIPRRKSTHVRWNEFQFGSAITQVSGFNPTMIKVHAMAPDRLLVEALDEGVTELNVVDETGRQYSVTVRVIGDVRQLISVIEHHFPDTSIQVTKLGDSVLLTGTANNIDHITQITEIAELFYPQVLNHIKFEPPTTQGDLNSATNPLEHTDFADDIQDLNGIK